MGIKSEKTFEDVVERLLAILDPQVPQKHEPPPDQRRPSVSSIRSSPAAPPRPISLKPNRRR
jgi:hypothetical protein